MKLTCEFHIVKYTVEKIPTKSVEAKLCKKLSDGTFKSSHPILYRGAAEVSSTASTIIICKKVSSIRKIRNYENLLKFSNFFQNNKTNLQL